MIDLKSGHKSLQVKEKHSVSSTWIFCARSNRSIGGKFTRDSTQFCYLVYRKVRQVIAIYLAQEAAEIFNGDIEIDESYFGGVRKGKRGCGTAGKVVVFGMLKRHGKVYTVVVENTKATTLIPVITNKIKPDSVVYTDMYRSYNALDVTEFHHHRINHSEAFADKKNHINGIENFWNQAKRVLRKYNGIDKKTSLCSWKSVSSDSTIEHRLTN